MLDPRAVRAAFKVAIDDAEILSDVTAYAFPPGGVVVPCVLPLDYAVDYESENAKLDGTGEWEWTILALASQADDVSGHEVRDLLVVGVPAALYADPTLGGAISDLMVKAIRTEGTRDWAGTDYLAVEFVVGMLG